MKFDVESKTSISNPSADDIARGINQINGDEINFAILGLDDMTYMQTAGHPTKGFVLEYQNGSLDEHYRAENEAIDKERIIETFQAFRDGDTSWFEAFEWQKEDLSNSGGCLTALLPPLVMLSAYGFYKYWG